MPKFHRSWTVVSHRPFEKLEDNLWRVEGDLPAGNGTRVMTLARMRDGGVLVHNAICLEPELMAELEAFGTPRVIVVPGGYHRLDALVWKQRYPSARIVGPAGARKRIEQAVRLEATYDAPLGDDDVRLAHLPGTADREGVLVVRSGERVTIVFNDAINNLPRLGGLFGILLAPTGVAAVPRIARWILVKDRNVLSAELERLAALPGLHRLIVSHGSIVEGGAAGETLKKVAARLRA
jgi:hypothetical protein